MLRARLFSFFRLLRTCAFALWLARVRFFGFSRTLCLKTPKHSEHWKRYLLMYCEKEPSAPQLGHGLNSVIFRGQVVGVDDRPLFFDGVPDHLVHKPLVDIGVVLQGLSHLDLAVGLEDLRLV